MRIALAQMNPTTGDFEGNVATALALVQVAGEEGADLVVFPPYALSGDAAGHMEGSAAFAREARAAVDQFAGFAPVPSLIGSLAGVGDASDDPCAPQAYFCDRGKITELPLAGSTALVSGFEFGGMTFAVSGAGLVTFPKKAAPDVFINMRAAAYKGYWTLPGAGDNYRAAHDVAKDNHMAVIVCNLVGGEDDKVYSGGSYCVASDGQLAAEGAYFKTDLLFVDMNDDGTCVPAPKAPVATEAAAEVAPYAAAYAETRPAVPLPTEADYRAITLAVADYMGKNGLSDAVVGLSGGMDSALVVTIAADALGPEHVHVVLMPSEYSSEGSITDSEVLAENLGIEDVRTIPINEPLKALSEALAPECDGAVEGIALENLQARIRTLYVMALSNTHGWTMLNTGNKSEAAMGFSTLYGDTAGAYAPLGDVYKTHVYDLAKWRNSQSRDIPKEIIKKVPSAELHPDQRDDDRIPPYDKLDPILIAHVEGGKGLDELIEDEFDPALSEDILSRVTRWEFKRRQEPLSPMISERSFAERDWPITNRFVDKGTTVE